MVIISAESLLLVFVSESDIKAEEKDAYYVKKEKQSCLALVSLINVII